MRRSGSAAPHSSWSPIVNAPRYAGPIASLRRRPTGNRHRAGDRGRRQVAQRRLAGVRHELHPCVVDPAIDGLDVGERHVLLQLDRQRLAVAAHRADAHAETVDRDSACADRPKPAPWPRILLVSAMPFHSSLRHAVAEVLVDPGDQAAAQRHAEVRRLLGATGRAASASTWRSISRIARLRIVEQRRDRGVERAVLRQQLAHVLRAAAGRGLVGHACSSTRPGRP